MKQCPNCGATIHDGDTFCRMCAMPVDSVTSVPRDINNLATNEFMTPSYPTLQEPNVEFFQEQNTSRITKSKIGYKEDTSNKKYVDRDGNDRAKATLLNFLGLAILLVMIAVIGIFLYETVFKEMI